MNHLAGKYGWLGAPQVSPSSFSHSPNATADEPPSSHQAYVSLKHESDKVIAYERAGLLFVFNFHATSSYTDYRVGVDEPGKYSVVLTSDEKRFGGFDNVGLGGEYLTTPMEWNNRRNFLQASFCGDVADTAELTFDSGLRACKNLPCSRKNRLTDW
jgi:1,4-alpha-glucan branching enzyme